ncbi:MAG: helix-turn-helix domain-containing protein [Prosthecobacter sp.]|uniref:helix-turn-helix domain-containing protein n=1 Tax=Prosthecobacter sp. TaxID=1965333 RepID=UPI0025EDF6E6|nr:helix-turn-helix domain-containing protein [Prosthecobacter sp.]MCF7785982.1 helix-turn-helix domain-containing protein [Prosthecobacter sp.]
MNPASKPSVNVQNHTMEPLRWLRVEEAARTRGISRSLLYEFLRDGKIKSSLLRKKGNVRGIRLISAESLDAYIESHVLPWYPETQETEVADNGPDG